jgi:hypothetical protein
MLAAARAVRCLLSLVCVVWGVAAAAADLGTRVGE